MMNVLHIQGFHVRWDTVPGSGNGVVVS